jgi:hypothetical protein
MAFYVTDLNLFDYATLNSFWKAYVSFSIILPVSIVTLVVYWYLNDYENHPLVRKLQNLCGVEGLTNWRLLANRINNEFRSIDKFSTGSMYNRVYLTETWLIKVNMYRIDLIRHDNILLNLTHTNDLKITQEGHVNIQYLHITVKPINACNQNEFKIKLNSFEYKDFKDHLQSPIQVACDLIIKQSLPDQFLDVFIENVDMNRVYECKREVTLTGIIPLQQKTSTLSIKKIQTSNLV